MTEQEQTEEQAWEELARLLTAQTELERMVLSARNEP